MEAERPRGHRTDRSDTLYRLLSGFLLIEQARIPTILTRRART